MSEYIDREELIEICENQGHADIDDVLSVPTADVVPVVHAHYNKGFCSNCGMPIATDCWGGGMERNNYCYYCGAKMDAE